MYALVMLEVVVGLAAVAWALERPRLGRLVVVTVLAGLLLYTHYWAIYLVIAVVGGLLLTGGARRRSARRVAVAVAAGVVLWLPWVPTFRFQAAHTATPWAAEASAFGRPPGVHRQRRCADPPRRAVRRRDGRRVPRRVHAAPCRGGASRSRRPGWPPSPPAPPPSACSAPSPARARSATATSPWPSRSSSSPPASGCGGWPVATCGWPCSSSASPARSWPSSTCGPPGPRRPPWWPSCAAQAQPGDLLIYCPDQLAPATDRLLRRDGPALVESVFPAGSTPARVDWIDYEDRAVAADPAGRRPRCAGGSRRPRHLARRQHHLPADRRGVPAGSSTRSDGLTATDAAVRCPTATTSSSTAPSTGSPPGYDVSVRQ